MIDLKVPRSMKDFFRGRRYFHALVAVLPLIVWAGLRGSVVRFGGSTEPPKEKNALVSIKVRDANVRDVLQNFAKQLGATLALDPAIQGKLSIRVYNSDLSDVMDDLCQVYSCKWSHSDHVLTVSRRPLDIKPY